MADIKVITSTLLADHNTIQITDSIINNNTIFEVYVSDPDIVCNNIVVGGTTANITFDTKPEVNTEVKIMLNNVNGNFSVNASDVKDGETTQSSINTNTANSISTLSNTKVDNSTLNERVPSNTVVGGCLYHGTTGNEWKRLTGSNVDYDNDSSINSVIGDVSSLSTSSDNLVGAINEVVSTIATAQDITNSFFSMASGYTLISNYSTITKIGNCIIGNVIIRKDNDFVLNNANIMGNINRNLYNVKNFRCYGMLSNNAYSIASVFGYITLNGDNIETWVTSGSYNHIRFDFITYIQ